MSDITVVLQGGAVINSETETGSQINVNMQDGPMIVADIKPGAQINADIKPGAQINVEITARGPAGPPGDGNGGTVEPLTNLEIEALLRM